MSVGKSILRVTSKTLLPIGGKTLADKIAPLGHNTIFQKSIRGYNPNNAYNSTARNYSDVTRQRWRASFEKRKAPFEDVISGSIHTAALIGAGIMTGNPTLMNMGVQKGIYTISGLGNQNEKPELQNVSEWLSLAISNLKLKNNKQIGKSNVSEEIIERSNNESLGNSLVDRTYLFDNILNT